MMKGGEIMSSVHNIKGTKDRKPYGYDSWLDFWKAKSGQTASLCQNTKCTKKCEVGAHVQKDGANEKHWYITPLCKGCNSLTTPFTVPDSSLVRVTDND